MMNDCERADALVKAWEEGSLLSSEDLAFLENHRRACPRCAGRHASVLPLVRRDAGQGEGGIAISRQPGPSASASASALALADGVMEAILGGEVAAPRLEIRSKTRRIRKAWGLPLLAAAAAAILAFVWFVPTMAGGSDKVVVRFMVAEPAARSVNLVGDFTNWKDKGYAMHPDASGRLWEIDVPLERGKVYLYNFIVDGTKWTVDPSAIEKVDDGFGGSSALLRL